MVAIYVLIDPRDGCVRYVGKSVNPRERLASHVRAARDGAPSHKYAWIRGLIAAGFRPQLDLIEDASSADANDAERYWIGCLLTVGARLVNMTPGGDGQPLGYRMPAESRARATETRRGRKLSPEQKQILREAFMRPEVRASRSEITKARMADPDQRAVAARGALNRPMSAEARAKISASWTDDRKRKHADEKSALPFDDKRRAQLAAALKARWDKHRAEHGGNHAG